MDNNERIDTLKLMVNNVKDKIKDIEYMLDEMVKPEEPPKPVIRKGKLKPDCKYCQDHAFWMSVAGSRECTTIFDIEYLIDGKVDCTADGYGKRPPEGKYGNGAILTLEESIEYLD
jgi:hypothetical protein